MKRLTPLYLAAALIIVLTGCNALWFGVLGSETSLEPPAASDAVEASGDEATFADALRAQGADVEAGGGVSQPFFEVPGEILRVNGEDVQVFVFPDTGSAEQAAAKINPDGSTATMLINWMAPPHFFRSDEVIVLYVGSNEALLDLLEGVLGPQFAGQ